MFIGEYSHTVDAKGRMSVPSKFRSELGDTFYVTKGLDGCLFVFPDNEWQMFQQKLRAIPLSNMGGRTFARQFFSGGIECSLDKQGRVNIAAHLRKHAGITKDVVVIGVGSRVEIWSLDNWNEYNNPDNIDYEKMAEQMAELGI